MKQTMLIAAMVITCALDGCASPVPTASSEQRITRPEIGTVQTKEVGEPLFETIIARAYDGVTFQPGTRLSDAVGFTVEPTGPFIQSSDGKYCGPATSVHNVWGDLNVPIPEYCVTETVLHAQAGSAVHRSVTRVEPGNFQQQLIYEGSVGNELRLSYREFHGDFARPAFTQDLTFDLAAGKTVGVKGARLEVLDVSNVGIRYRVLQPFKD
ncbi:MAG TPA: hypothetical protein VIM56_07380 [Rhizomicrobium sp.]